MNDSHGTLIDGISSDDDDSVIEHSCSKSTIINGDSESNSDSESESDCEGSKLVGFSSIDVGLYNKVSLRLSPILGLGGGVDVFQKSVVEDYVGLQQKEFISEQDVDCMSVGHCKTNSNHHRDTGRHSIVESDKDDSPRNDCETNESFRLHFSLSESEVESGDESENHVASVKQKLLTSYIRKQKLEKLQMVDSVLESVRNPENMQNIFMTNSVESDGDNSFKDNLDDYEDNFHLYFSGSESEIDGDNESEICSSSNEKRSSTSLSRKRKLQLDDSTKPISKLAEKCCSNKCMDPITEGDIVYCQQQMKNKNESDQKQFILCEISKHTKSVTNRGKIEYEHHFIISGNFVCPKAWCIAHSVSEWRFQQCLKLFKSGVVNIQHGNKGHQRKRCKTVLALAWMTNLFKTIGDYMPHKPVVHLHHDWTKRSVYDRMVKELRERGDITDSISYSHFTRIWSRYLGKFIIPNSTDFTKCTVCTRLKETFDKVTFENERKKIAHLKTTHDKLVEAERRSYQDAREKARRNPREMTCVIIDGMDQSKTDVPHLLVKDKDTSHLARLPVHLTGVLVHTASPEGKLPLIFHDVKQIPHDSNLTIHCITEALIAAQDYLGKVLFLQMDNCFRENKNKFVLSYAALLVERDIFEEVYVHFLPVGHTHEDVDQMFSCVAQHLRHTNVYTLEDLAKEAAKSFTPNIDVRPVITVQDVKVLLGQHLYGHFANHSRPLWFRFRKVDRRCYMHFKKWECEMWKPESCEEYPHGYLVLKDVPELSQHLEWVVPNLERLDVEKLTKELPEAYRHRLPTSAQHWWAKYMSTLSSTYVVPPDKVTWNLMQLAPRSQSEMYASIDPKAIEELENIIADECPDVQIGNQGRVYRNKVTLVDNYISVSNGDLVAVHLEETTGRPFVAKVLERTGDKVSVHWMRGSWTGQWQMWMNGVGKRAKAYTSVVPVSSLILWNFSFTNKQRLKKNTVESLRSKYLELDGR